MRVAACPRPAAVPPAVARCSHPAAATVAKEPGWADGVSVVLIIHKSECVRFRVRVRVRVFFLYLWRISFNFNSVFKLWQKVICF